MLQFRANIWREKIRILYTMVYWKTVPSSIACRYSLQHTTKTE